MLIPFSPPPGLNSDDTIFSAKGQWADGLNVRFHNGKPQPIGGWVGLSDVTATVGSSKCRAIHALDRGGTAYVAFGFASSGSAPKLLVGTVANLVVPTAPSDETPVSLATTSTDWTFGSWGTTLLACPNGQSLYEQSGTSTATVVTNAPDNITGILVTDQRQVLALGCNEESSGTFNGRCVRGCDIEDYTDWTTSASNNAFEHILDDDGVIVAGRKIGSSVAIWTTGSLYLGQFLGDPGQTYRFERIDANCGLIGPKAVAILNQRAFWIGTDGRARTWAVGTSPQIIPCAIGKHFIDGIDLGQPVATSGSPARMCAVTISKFNEVRWYYPHSLGENDSFIALDIDTGLWHRANDPNGVTDYGRTAALEHPLLATPIYDSPIVSVNTADVITVEETGIAGTGSNPYAWHIESAGIYLDEAHRRLMVRSVIPDFEDQSGSISLTLTVRDRPQASATTKGPFTLTTATTKKDFRASGKMFTVKISGADSTYARLGKLLFDVVPMGER
jgi:hypothetical protein